MMKSKEIAELLHPGRLRRLREAELRNAIETAKQISDGYAADLLMTRLNEITRNRRRREAVRDSRKLIEAARQIAKDAQDACRNQENRRARA